MYSSTSLTNAAVQPQAKYRIVSSQSNIALYLFVVSPSLHLQILITTDLLSVFIILPFQECPINGIIQYVAKAF